MSNPGQEEILESFDQSVMNWFHLRLQTGDLEWQIQKKRKKKKSRKKRKNNQKTTKQDKSPPPPPPPPHLTTHRLPSLSLSSRGLLKPVSRQSSYLPPYCALITSQIKVGYSLAPLPISKVHRRKAEFTATSVCRFYFLWCNTSLISSPWALWGGNCVSPRSYWINHPGALLMTPVLAVLWLMRSFSHKVVRYTY